ncbi:hypothetical protein O0L34_g19322 [Tuta absoluta]|nr:hypothetical protein O0L34_g19322 [Tuta absoluta]
MGLAKRDKEDAKEMITLVAKKLHLKPEDIEIVKRVGVEKQREDAQVRPQPVIVTLRTKAARDEWMAKCKQRITNGDVYQDESKGNIYINEDLPKHLCQLFWTAKQQLKSSYEFIWIQNSRILVKANNNTNKKNHLVRSEGDIKQLVQQTVERGKDRSDEAM